MEQRVAKFRRLDPDKIIETIRSLRARIEERFPGSGLGRVVAELLMVAEETAARTTWIQQPHLPLRAAAGVLSLAVIALVIALLLNIHQFHMDDFTNSVQALDSSIGSVVFIGAAILFFGALAATLTQERA